MRFRLFSLAVGLLCLLSLTGYLLWQSIPMVLAGLVRLVPVSIEEQLGRAVVAGLARPGSVCEDEATKTLVKAAVARLESAMPKSAYQFDVQVVKNPQVNAMAAPGGHIVVFSGLIDKMDNPEQLAAVLAHEMQHVVQRHSMKGIVRAVGLQAFLSLVIGDPGILGDLAGNLTVLHFIRSDEESADDAALDTLMRAGIAPVEMQKAFENLSKGSEERGFETTLKYLSTHPPLRERIERVKQRGGAWKGESRPLGERMGRACVAGR